MFIKGAIISSPEKCVKRIRIVNNSSLPKAIWRKEDFAPGEESKVIHRPTSLFPAHISKHDSYSHQKRSTNHTHIEFTPSSKHKYEQVRSKETSIMWVMIRPNTITIDHHGNKLEGEIVPFKLQPGVFDEGKSDKLDSTSCRTSWSTYKQ